MGVAVVPGWPSGRVTSPNRRIAAGLGFAVSFIILTAHYTPMNDRRSGRDRRTSPVALLLIDLGGIVWLVLAVKNVVLFSLSVALSVLQTPLGAPIALVAGVIEHCRQALGAVDEERERTEDERAAFAAFARRVAEIEPGTPAASTDGGEVAAVTRPPDPAIERVKEAYRDTVMAVPHYDEEYGESLESNVAAEFSAGLAAALSSGEQLTPQMRTLLVRAATDASERRTDFLDVLDDEECQLSAAESSLACIDAGLDDTESGLALSFDELHERYHCLEDLESECESLLERRQRQIDAQRASVPGSDADIQEYLYRRLPVTYPVLADSMGLVRRITARRRELVDALSRRV